MASITWGSDIAQVYDDTYAGQFDRAVLDPMLETLVDLARGGPVVEFGIGTGRVALPLAERGVVVQGIELSPSMVDQMRTKPGADAVPVTIGDMTTARLAGAFELVYLVANTIMNVTTQEEQLAVFANAAAHLTRGGRFVVEVIVPQLQHVPPGDSARVFRMEPDHVGIETFDDQVEQIAWSHHWIHTKGRVVHHSAPFRYVWPSELVLMGRLAGFRLRHRWATWQREPFTADSTSQIAVFEKQR
jgi:SAM-dependent methyltransferase